MGTRVLDASRLPPAAAVSSRRAWAVAPLWVRVSSWNSSLRLSAAQDSDRAANALGPRGTLQPIHPAPGHAHSRTDPVAREKISILAPTWGLRGLKTDMASLLPSGDTARPERLLVSGGSGSGLRRPGGPDRLSTSRSHVTGP